MSVPRLVLTLVLLLCAAPSVPATAQTIPTDAIAIVTDPETLEREVPAGRTTFPAYVVFLNPQPGLRTVGAAQFGIELDPGLSLVAETTDGLMFQPAPLEYVVAYPDMVSSLPQRNCALRHPRRHELMHLHHPIP